MNGYIEITITARIPVNRDSYPDDVQSVGEAAGYEADSYNSGAIGLDDLLSVADEENILVTFKGVSQ